MKQALALFGAVGLVTACIAPLPPTPPPYPPMPPAPIIRKDEGVPPPSRKAQPIPSSFVLPNGTRIKVVEGTELLSSCAVFGIPESSKKPTICIALPASLADGKGGGKAQDNYAALLRSAGYSGSYLPLAYRDRKGCRQHVMLSTLPSDAQRSDNWSGVKTYILFMEFTPMTCPE